MEKNHGLHGAQQSAFATVGHVLLVSDGEFLSTRNTQRIVPLP